MHLSTLIFQEILLRKWNALLMFMAIFTAVSLYVALETMGAAADKETARLMRDLGFNLRIIPAQTDEATFWTLGYSPDTMPESHVQRFTEQEGLSYRHLLATLQQKVTVDGVEFLFAGIDSEVTPLGVAEKKR